MKYDAEIITEWEKVPIPGMGLVNQPLVGRLFALDSWTDTTAQNGVAIAAGGGLVLQCVVEKVELDKIKADPKHHCLWCKPVAGTDPAAEPPDAAIPQIEENALRVFLTARGTTATGRNLAVGARKAGRTRRQVSQRIKSWLRTLKKAA